MPRRLVLLSAVLFGTTGTARALGPDGLSPLVAGAARIAVGGALLAAFALLSTERGTAPRMSKGALVVAAVAVAAYQLSFFLAVRDTGVAVGTVVALGSAPAFAGALARVVLGAPLTRRWGLSTALATAGVALLAGAGHAATVSLRGVLLALAAGAGYAVYTVVAKRELEAGHAPERVMAAAFGLGAVLLLPILLVGDTHALWTPGGLGLALYLGAIPTAVAYVLFARGLRQLGAGETATLTLAEPLTAAALGAVVLGERPGALAVAGAALVLAGLAALALPPGRRAAAAAIRRRHARARPVSARPLPRVSTVEALATVLREQILAGELAPGARLREQHLAVHHDVARHTVRATLRALEAEGIVRIEPNRGAHVARLDARAVEELYALRAALEVEAARLALEAGGGRLPDAVHDAVARLSALCARPGEPWSAVADAHADVHSAIVAAAGAPRIAAAHAALQGEMRLIVAGLRPTWSRQRMAAHHEVLVAELERTGAEALRPHLADGARTLRQAAEKVGSDPSERSNASASAAASGFANR